MPTGFYARVRLIATTMSRTLIIPGQTISIAGFPGLLGYPVQPDLMAYSRWLPSD